MARNFQTHSHKNIGKGVDKRSAENNIQPGYAEDIRNMDTNSSGYVEKRKGYQGYHGSLPLRVSAFTDNGDDTATISFDPGINLISATDAPIVIYGLLNESDTTPTEYYFTNFTNNTRKTIAGGTTTTTTITNPDSSVDMLAGAVELTGGTGSLDNKAILLDNITLNYTTDIDFEFDLTGDPSSKSVYVFTDDTTIEDTYLYADTLPALDGVINIPASTHNIPNYFIVPQIYRIDETSYIQSIPDSFTIETNGDIVIDMGPTYPDEDYHVVIYDMPIDYYQEQYLTAGSKPVTFSNITNSLNFYGVLITLADGSREIVIPDEFVYNELLKSLTFSVVLTSAATVGLTYMPGIASSNSVNVVIESDDWETNTSPQASLYGIDSNSVSYITSAERGGYVHGLAEYSSRGTSYMTAAFDGVLYKESSVSGSPLTLPTNIHVDWASRTLAASYIGPFFGGYDATNSQRGVNADEINTSDPDNRLYRKAPLSSIINNGDGTATLSLGTLTNKTGLLVDLTTYDRVTLSNVGNSWYSGTFTISSVDDEVAVDDINNTITVTIPNLPAFIPSETSVKGELSITSASVVMNGTGVSYASGDTIASTLFSGYSPSVVGVVTGTNDTLYIDGVEGDVSVSASALIGITRTTDTIKLTNIAYFVENDTVSLSGYGRKFRITDVDYSASTITIDESVCVSDSVSAPTKVTVSGRWVPIEAPAQNANIETYFDQASFGNQPKLQSASINDSVFFSNYNDDIMKFDGTSLYRAGLPAWNPSTHSWVDTSSSGVAIPRTGYVTLSTGGVMVFADANDIPTESEIYLHAESETGTIVAGTYSITAKDTSAKSITISASSCSVAATDGYISVKSQVAYYFKLEAVDRNNNIIASAVTDYRDCIVEMTQSGKITHKLTGMPKFDVYDYDRINLGIYRSKVASTVAPVFYNVRTVEIDFVTANARNAIIVEDTVSDTTLTNPDDRASQAMKGADLPISSQAPARAKYINSVGNRLILSNIRSYNTIDMKIESSTSYDDESNEMDNSVVSITDGTTTYGFKYLNPLNGANLDTTNCRKITSIDFTSDPDFFILTLDGSIVTDLDTNGSGWIQVESFLTKNAGTGMQQESAATTIDGSNGNVCGWHKVSEHTIDTNDTIKIVYTHGIESDWTSGATEAFMYVGFEHASSNIPIMALPHAESVTTQSVDKITYKDTTAAIDLTTARYRAMIDLREAFNRVMVEDSAPWAFANAGASLGNGAIRFSALHPDTSLSITTTIASTNDIKLFVNQAVVASGVSASGVTYVYPSRLAVSPERFPEMFDNPFAPSAIYGDSIIDINADDGQEITGMSSFFSVSSSTDSAVEDTLIVFKNQSVFAVNVATREQKKLESLGQGCTIPNSISPAQDGIIFANESGIYKVTRNLTVEYVGAMIESYWDNDVSSTYVETEAFGFTDALNRKYKLSVPTTTSRNSEVVVLDYIGDKRSDVEGSWTIYNNFPAALWAQTRTNTFFGGYGGRIFTLRNLGDETDYRDDTSGISCYFVYGAQSFGDSGSRVNVSRVITHLKAKTNITSAALVAATDMDKIFTNAGTFNFTTAAKKLHTLATSLPETHCLFLQVKYTHSTIDENLVIAGIDFEVVDMDELGIKQENE